jgi:hypothetical protein
MLSFPPPACTESAEDPLDLLKPPARISPRSYSDVDGPWIVPSTLLVAKIPTLPTSAPWLVNFRVHVVPKLSDFILEQPSHRLGL